MLKAAAILGLLARRCSSAGRRRPIGLRQSSSSSNGNDGVQSSDKLDVFLGSAVDCAGQVRLVATETSSAAAEYGPQPSGRAVHIGRCRGKPNDEAVELTEEQQRRQVQRLKDFFQEKKKARFAADEWTRLTECLAGPINDAIKLCTEFPTPTEAGLDQPNSVWKYSPEEAYPKPKAAILSRYYFLETLLSVKDHRHFYVGASLVGVRRLGRRKLPSVVVEFADWYHPLESEELLPSMKTKPVRLTCSQWQMLLDMNADVKAWLHSDVSG